MADETELQRARSQLQRASDAADRPIQEQLDSIQAGVFEELAGDHTAGEPGPKVERVAELAEKLSGLEEEASGEARDRIGRARDHCLTYQRQRTDG